MKALLAIVFAGMAAGSSPAVAQTLDRAEIHGTIRDETGATLDNVAVTLRENTTGFVRITGTREDGFYSVPLIPVGTYVVQAERVGFATAESDPLSLTLGQSLVVNLMMKVAGVTQTVSVSAVANAAPALGTVFETADIKGLPVNGRDYRDFALLAPTAQRITGTRGTFRVAGQPGDYLALNVDGADFTNNFFGEFFGSLETQNLTIPLEAVHEIEVSVGGSGTEFGRSNGGLINIVTKSGTNQRSGSLDYFLRHHALTANDAFGNPPSGLVRHTGGGSVGGPLAADRTFYFVAAEFDRQNTPITVTFARNVAGVAVPELGIANLAALEGQYARDQDVTTALGKVDHLLTPNHRLSVRALFTRHHGDNIAGGGTLLTQSTSSLETFLDQGVSMVASLSDAVGTRLFVDTKFQASRETRPRMAQSTQPQVQIADTGTFGGSEFLPATQDMYRYQASNNVAYGRGNHDLKIGTDYNGFNMRNNAFALALNGAYVFPTLEAFVQRQPSLYAQNFGLNGDTAQQAALLHSFWQHEFAAYVQDRVRPNSRLTIGFGLRYDAQINPQPQAGTAGGNVPVGPPVIVANAVQLTYAPVPQGIPNDLNNWGPRGDFAYQLTDSSSTIVKGSAGMYFGRTPMIYFPLRGSGVSNTTLFAPPSQFGVTFPNVLPSAIVPGSQLAALLGAPAISYVDPGFNNPRVFETNISLAKRLGDLTLEAGYIFSHSSNLRIGGFRSTIWDRNLAPPTTFDAFGRGIDLLSAPRPDPTISQANALASFGRGRYDALLITLHKPLLNGWQWYANYTLSRSLGDGSTERDTEAAFGPSDPFNPAADYGLTEMDERHQFKSTLMTTLPHDILVASTWSAGSGLAFPVYSPSDINSDGVSNNGFNPDRPVVDGRLLPRFPYHQPAWFTWDLRVAKGWAVGTQARAQLILDLFNLLNTLNTYADPQTQAVLGSPNFRVNNRTLGPRLAQLGVRVEF